METKSASAPLPPFASHVCTRLIARSSSINSDLDYCCGGRKYMYVHSQQTRDIDSMLVHCWASVVDGGQTGPLNDPGSSLIFITVLGYDHIVITLCMMDWTAKVTTTSFCPSAM